MNNTMLQFDFHENEQGQPVIFTNPKQIIMTNKYDEIDECLQRIEHAIQDGYYVAGYFNYEVAYSFFDVNLKHQNESMPLLSFGVFEKPTHNPHPANGKYSVSNWKMLESKESYETNFAHIMKAIKSGITDQVNYTVPFKATFSGDSFTYYDDLKRSQQSSYSAYLHFDLIDIVSVSPELFFHYDRGQITVRPMKGTIKRGKSFEEDQLQYNTLQTSEKDRNENELITKLMKDELKQVAHSSNIHVTEAFTIEQYPTVYQMTSTIKAQIKEETRMTSLFKQLFPCGSISGVPKQATLQLIKNIEPYARGVYCGAIGYFTPNDTAIFNVPIRTVSIDRQNGIATYGAGGAITAKSTMEDEYEEVHTKTKVLTHDEPTFQLIETFGLINGDIIVLEEHMSRVINSANYFKFAFEEQQLRSILKKYVETYKNGEYRIRCLLHKNGDIEHEIVTLTNTQNKRVVLAPTSIDSSNKFLYHKTTYRDMYEQVKVDGYFDTLLWNEENEITEFTIGNIVIELNNTLYTPPQTSGLLNGTYRQMLLNEGLVRERVIYKDELTKATNMWLINSVRKWVNVTF